MLGAKKIVASVFREQQPVQEQGIGEITSAGGLFAEKRTARAPQRALLDFAQRFKNFLARLAQNDFLPYLELRQALAILMRLLLAHVVVALEQYAAALQHLQKLLVHFRAQEFRHRQPCQQVDRQLEFTLGSIERCDLQFGEQRSPLGWIFSRLRGFAGLVAHPRRPLRRRRSFRCQQSFQIAMARNQACNLRPRRLHKPGTQHNVVAQVVHADAQPFKRHEGRGRSQARQLRLVRRSA